MGFAKKRSKLNPRTCKSHAIFEETRKTEPQNLQNSQDFWRNAQNQTPELVKIMGFSKTRPKPNPRIQKSIKNPRRQFKIQYKLIFFLYNLRSLPRLHSAHSIGSGIRDVRRKIQDVRSKIRDFRSEIHDFRCKIRDFRSEIRDFRSKIQVFRSKL